MKNINGKIRLAWVCSFGIWYATVAQFTRCWIGKLGQHLCVNLYETQSMGKRPVSVSIWVQRNSRRCLLFFFEIEKRIMGTCRAVMEVKSPTKRFTCSSSTPFNVKSDWCFHSVSAGGCCKCTYGIDFAYAQDLFLAAGLFDRNQQSNALCLLAWGTE